jgi:hypothetical protein
MADDTRSLLRTGGSICGFGLLCAVYVLNTHGGVGIHGPTTNVGWLALIAVIMCVPFGLMLLALGFAKWMRGRKHPDEMN